jgi:hypothetical protein
MEFYPVGNDLKSILSQEDFYRAVLATVDVSSAATFMRQSQSMKLHFVRVFVATKMIVSCPFATVLTEERRSAIIDSIRADLNEVITFAQLKSLVEN